MSTVDTHWVSSLQMEQEEISIIFIMLKFKPMAFPEKFANEANRSEEIVFMMLDVQLT